MIEGRLRTSGLLCEIRTAGEESAIPQIMDDVTRRNIPYAITLTSQNEVHRSLTMNILHGTPQEHRNMPMEDALSLVSRNFEAYVKELREKALAPPTPAPAPAPTPAPAALAPSKPDFIAPDAQMSYLLNLLADNRHLTAEELDKVVQYLRERRDRIIESQGGKRPGGDGDSRQSLRDEKAINEQQQELQAKILSILNGSGGGPPSPTAVAAAAQLRQQQTQNSDPYRGMGGIPRAPPPPQSSNPMNSTINFDNPSVQQALDNLIQSGPNLLRNISAVQAPPAPQQPNNMQSLAQAQQQAIQAGYGHLAQQQMSQQQQMPPQRGHGGGVPSLLGGMGNSNMGGMGQYGGMPQRY